MTFKAVSFVVLALVAGGSIAARAMIDEEPPRPSPSSTALTTGLVPGDTPQPKPPSQQPQQQPPQPESDGVAKALPTVSEASFFAIIGFALGYASKKVLKLALIVLALFFVALQVLSYAKIITIDWQAALDVTNRLILDVHEDDTVGEVIKNRLPAAGGIVLGYALGFRKG